VDTLLGSVVELLGKLPKELPVPVERSAAPVIPSRPRAAWSVRKEDGVFVVESEELERMVAMANTRDPRVLLQVWREMSKRGMAQRMSESGIEPGDTIRIGSVEIEWF
jgi:GTP-binding protein